MVLNVPPKIQNLWNEWNLRSAVLTSLTFQIILILCSSWRKRTGGNIVASIIWASYLLADWFAAFAGGLIQNGLQECGRVTQDKEILGFWAPFLLLHLGGPDNITAYALEDNELWARHLLGLGVQLLAVSYVLSQTLPNPLTVPTVLIFVAGTIKYAERTASLCGASLDRFKNSMLPTADAGPNYAQLMEEYSWKQTAGVPVRIDIAKEKVKEDEKDPEAAAASSDNQGPKLKDVEVVEFGYYFFWTFKGLIVDLMFSYRERNESRAFFLKRNAEDAFKVIEVELNFMFDALYTKMPVVHGLRVFDGTRVVCRPHGYILRFISTSCVLISLVLYHLHIVQTHKNVSHPFDRRVSYTLIVGALVLDFIGLFKLIFSDWTVVKLKNYPGAQSFVSLIQTYCSWDKSWRWSKQIRQHNLISYCLRRKRNVIEIIAGDIGVKGIEKFDNNLQDFIFNEIKGKAGEGEKMEKAKEIYSGKGDWVLSQLNRVDDLKWSVDVEFDESLILWHIATNLCDEDDEEKSNGGNFRIFSKILSQYMLHLLIMKPKMMSAVAGIGQIRYMDTCEETKRFILKEYEDTNTENAFQKLLEIGGVSKLFGQEESSRSTLEPKELCKGLLAINTEVKPGFVKGDKSKSVLFDACRLAKNLGASSDESSHEAKPFMNKTNRWELISKVWLEMLAYAATHIRAETHADEISKGGELLSFVWLLMAHFGLGDQFRILAGHAKAKLIVEK